MLQQQSATQQFIGHFDRNITGGENLLILGGACAGESEVAREVHDQTVRLGFRSHILSSDYNPLAISHFIEPADVHSANGQARFYPELLEADVLIVDQAQRWLEVASLELTFLLCERIALGRSNVLIMSSLGFKQAVKAGLYQKRPSDDDILTLLRSVRGTSRASWSDSLLRCGSMSFELQLQMLGIGLLGWNDPRKRDVFDLLSVPRSAQASAVKEQFDLGLFAWCDQSLTEWMQGPGWKPVWQVVYTGEQRYN